MTTYLYHCPSCSTEVEVRAQMSRRHSRVHQVCGTEMRRIWTAPSISFRGDGFYATSGRRTAASPEKQD